MKTMKIMVLLAVAAAFVGVSAKAQVVAAWDFTHPTDPDHDAASTPGWKTFDLGDSSSDTVGDLTLTQAATGDWVVRELNPVATQENAPALLTAGSDEMNDGFDLDNDLHSPDTQYFTLSGLTTGQTYRIQFIGAVRHTADAQGRNLTMSVNVDGTSTADLFSIPSLTTGENAGYSEYVEFTAASSQVDITFGEVSSGVKTVAGLIVEEIEGPEPPEPEDPIVFTHAGMGEGGTNFVMSWTSEEGQFFNLLGSGDLAGWSNLVDNIPAATTSTQTSYAVALEEMIDNRFFRVRSTSGRPPNIIMLFADDLGYGDVGCYGHPYAKTPNLDTLASQGTLFRKFNVTGTTCNPSRTGLLTSWHPDSFAYNTSDEGFNQAHLPGGSDHITIMELLNDAGYRTGHFGKWHIGPDDNPGDVTNGMYGIDEIILEGGGGNDPRGRDEKIYGYAIDFIEANKDTNFYVNVMGRVTHSPVNPRPELVESAGFTNVHTYFDRNDFAGQQIQDIFDGVIANGGNITNSMANYMTEVYYLDVFIGELLNKLDELGIADNTIIAFSSDQGAAVPDYDPFPPPPKEYNLVGWSGGLRGQKHDQHEGGIRSPFILRWPGYVPAGKVNTNSITSALDWLPTLCEIADVTINPAEFQGESVLDIWKGSDRSRNGPQFWSRSLKKDDWRIYFTGGGLTAEELYDLSTDLSETNNLLTARPDIVDELTDIWSDWKDSLP